MKEIGLTIINMEKAIKNLVMPQYMRVAMSRESLKDMEGISGKMDKYTKDSGQLDSKMDLAYGEAQKETLTLESGKKGKLMDMEFTHGSTGTGTRDSFKTV